MADDPRLPPDLGIALDWLDSRITDMAGAARRGATRLMTPSSLPTAPPVPARPQARDPESRPATRPAVAAKPIPSPAVPAAVPLAAATPRRAAPTLAPPAAASKTPLLDAAGRDLTAEAEAGTLPPILGREAEIEAVIETLARTTKRTPVLVGPPGAGRTAIVEGLASRIVAGRVPAVLRGNRVVALPLSALVAGTQYRGALEERLAALVTEASQAGLILYIEEIDQLAAVGRSETSASGADALLRPALERGSLALIGSTTPDGYAGRIARNASLARLFTPLPVSEIGRAQAGRIVAAARDALADRRGVHVSDAALTILLDFADRRIVGRRFPDKGLDLLEMAVARAVVTEQTRVRAVEARAIIAAFEARAASTPVLSRLGRDLCSLAAAGSLGPIIGRDAEIDLVIETLMRTSKRNPLLLGPAGSGKTAIVEGFAGRLAAGEVPEGLRDHRLFDVSLTALADAVEADGEVLADFLAEAGHPLVLVFFDEIHILAMPAARKLAEALKPVLARGEIANIGATTGAEYDLYLAPEAALARRYSPIQVSAMDDRGVADVLRGVRDKLATRRGVTVSDEALATITDLASRWLPNRAFPDKGVDLIEQSVAYALTHGQTKVDGPAVSRVVSRLIGMPLDFDGRLALLRSELAAAGLLSAADRDRLVGRLAGALRGLDADPAAPNAVVLLAGPAAATAEALADLLARALFGRATARIDIELAAMTDDSALSTLLGSAPGLVGSQRSLPLHELLRNPFSVVSLRSIDRAALAVGEAITAALAAGAFTDAMGRSLPLGGAIVVLTAPATDSLDALPTALREHCDVVVMVPSAGLLGLDAAEALLTELAARFARSGLDVTFPPGFVSYLAGVLPAGGPRAAARYLDRELVPALLTDLPADATRLEAVISEGRPRLIAAS